VIDGFICLSFWDKTCVHHVDDGDI